MEPLIRLVILVILVAGKMTAILVILLAEWGSKITRHLGSLVILVVLLGGAFTRGVPRGVTLAILVILPCLQHLYRLYHCTICILCTTCTTCTTC